MKKRNIIFILSSAVLLLLGVHSYGQQPENGEGRMENGERQTEQPPFSVARSPFPNYEVSMYATLGAAALSGNITAGSMYPAAIAAGVGADVSWYFTRHWGLGAGVEAAFPNLQLSSGSIVRTLGAASSLHKYTTRIDATCLRLPLWLCFHTPVRRHWLYAAAGASLDLALTGRYRTETTVRTGSHIQTATTHGRLSFRHGASLTAEAGFRWTLDSEWGIYTGLYTAYGLSDICPTGNDALRDVTRLNLLLIGIKVKITIVND
jgi:hypothetical protein